MLSIDGLISGLDTTTIVEGLLEIQQNQINLLQERQDKVATEQTAFKGIEAQLLNLQSKLNRLSSPVNNVFRTKTAASSNEAGLVAAATEDAVAGVYSVRVNSLARAHQVASQGFVDADSLITQGTIGFRVGSGEETVITVDGTNNTLQGLADAINSASSDVSASIINDGTAGTPYRLLLTARQTGAANAITITNNLGADNGTETQPQFNLAAPVQDAADASITLGSGAGAITVSSATNTVESVIPGVALDLLTADPAAEITVTVSSDTADAQTAVEEFVQGFNDLMKFIDDQVRYDAEADRASPLLGNRSVVSIQDDVRRAVSEVVEGVNIEANRLSAIGITFTDQGRLTINTSELSRALNGDIEGVDIDDVRRLFALDGQSDNANIQFVLAGKDTVASPVGYGVDVTVAPERAAITAANPLALSTVIDATNDTLEITIDRATATLTLTHGTYTAQELADHLEDVINESSELLGRQVSVALNSSQLVITSDKYGASSEVTIGAGSANAALGFAGTETDFGVNVSGSYLVNGVSESATGSGRLLVGGTDNQNTAGLQVRVTLPPGQVQAGAEGTVTITRGLASRLDRVLSSLLDPVDGRVATVNNGFEDRIEDIQESIDRQNELFEAQREALVSQFVALESALAELQTTSNFLASQLSGLATVGVVRR